MLIYYQNVRSIICKIGNLIPIINTCDFDIIAFSETWLTPAISNLELNFFNYTVYRCDRSAHNSNFGRGGGVLIAINSNLKSKVLKVSFNCVEHIFVLLQLSNINFIIGCVYIPPRSHITVFENFFSAINELINSNPTAKLILLGDFNLPSLVRSNTTMPTNCRSTTDSYFTSMLSFFDINQYNFIPNHNDVMLVLLGHI